MATDKQRLARLEAMVRQLQGGERHYVGAAGEPAFENSWVNYDGGTTPSSNQRSAYFYKQGNRVFLGGVIKGGTPGLRCFLLPAEYCPRESDMVFLAFANAAPGDIVVADGGSVIPQNLGGSNVNGFVFLDGISFRAAT